MTIAWSRWKFRLLALATVQFILACAGLGGWYYTARDLDAARAQAADLQQQLDAATQKLDAAKAHKIHASAIRFVGFVQPHQRMSMIADGMVTMTSNDIPDLGKQILDWLVHNPGESARRGLVEIKAELY